ncbi:MAG TPA: glycoside hydrolase family 3 N-terminal domain-containing protein, partial [Candidatus Limnocylindrales bacterium]|nr:glycoside hydrolase family 3 N-terminal domain-containing protein [Candidatus Limnocylindrales bacterium]
MHRRIALLGVAVALIAPLLTGLGSPAPASAAGPTLAQLIGQKLIVRMDGTTPSADLLGRIRRGEVGGVILFGSNITTKTALIALTRQLHAAAAAGGQPRFLIAVDQEGGAIKRIPWAPPTLSPPQMGALRSTSTARSQGLQTGTALKALGIDIDLAPVADVPASTSSILYRQGRTWSFSATLTASLTDAFTTGLKAGGEIPTMKHFPGLGY